jgi:hypothetical protein
MARNAKTPPAFFSNDFRNKKNPYSYHQIIFLLQNINDGDKMKA